MKLHQSWSGNVLAAGFAAMALSASAHASLANDVNVSLIAPGGDASGNPAFTFSQLAPLTSGIQVGDGGAIGSYMLPGEQISFSGNSILLHVAAGWDDGLGHVSTGYLGLGADHARYLLDNLNITGASIVGINAYAFDGYGTSGYSGVLSPMDPASYTHWVNAHAVSVDLDTLLFNARTDVFGNTLGSSYDYAELRIDLITAAVPEPATTWMAMAGFGLLALMRRRASRSLLSD